MICGIDASLALTWALEEKRAPEIDNAIEAIVRGGACVPMHRHLEVANGLTMALRRKRIDVAFRDRAFQTLSLLGLEIDPETSARAWTDTTALADRFGLTLHDAAYLELAARRRLPLASLDGELRQAAAGAGVPLLGY